MDQVLPLGQHAFRAAGAPLDGHDALRAEGAAVGAASWGHHREGFRAIHGVGGRLQVGVAIHLEEMVGWERQGVQVGNGGMVGVVALLAIVGKVADAQ